MTRRIQYYAETPWASCKRATVIEVQDSATESEVEEAVRDAFFNEFNYSWAELGPDEEGEEL